MGTNTSMTVEIFGSEQEISNIADVMQSAFSEERSYVKIDKNEMVNTGLLQIKFTYKFRLVEHITDLAEKMAQAARGSIFTLSGVIDDSESAGEYMNYKISYGDGEIEERSSNWYMYPAGMLDEMTYEEFCENYGDEYTKDDFEKMQQGWFIVETSRTGITMMPSVPLDQVRTLNVK